MLFSLSPFSSHLPPVLCCHAPLFVTPGTVAHPAPLSIKFRRQEYWSGLPFSTPGDLPDPGIELVSPFYCVGRRILYHQATWGASRPPHPAPSVDLWSLGHVGRCTSGCLPSLPGNLGRGCIFLLFSE